MRPRDKKRAEVVGTGKGDRAEGGKLWRESVVCGCSPTPYKRWKEVCSRRGDLPEWNECQYYCGTQVPLGEVLARRSVGGQRSSGDGVKSTRGGRFPAIW